MDVTQSLKDAENALRDFIAIILSTKYGATWLQHAGVSPDRLVKWNERKDTEAKRQEAGVVEERILYYADFYDLGTILKKNWNEFAAPLGDWKRMEVWLKELERLRDPDAHRRELLPHQKHLILGISGEIRNRIVRYRSKQEQAEDYFPRIESVRDSLGAIWTPAYTSGLFDTKAVVRPGVLIDFVVTASDPLGEQLSYGMECKGESTDVLWQDTGTFSLRIEERDVSLVFIVPFMVKSPRKHHAFRAHDDKVTFIYKVLPPMDTRVAVEDKNPCRQTK
jgi:hypothetical protein